LETKSEYKEKSIMEIKDQLREMNVKIDALSENVSKLITKSEKGDTKLENRVKSLEDKIDIYEKFFASTKEEQDKRTRNIIAISAVIASIIGILISILIKFI
jgi:uncharacterized coiled-coil protein SlyX